MTIEPEDLIGLAEAATVAERTSATVRRWVRSGALTRYEGAPASHGGSPVVLVSREELLGYLAETSQKPRTQAKPSPIQAPPVTQVSTGETAQPSDLIIADLRAQLALAGMRAELAKTAAALEAERTTVSRLQNDLAQMKTDLAEARDELTASESRARALADQLRQADVRAAIAEQRAAFEAGRSWWRRLIGGPVAELE